MIFPSSVKLVGGPGVGKTTLREKFLYPDYVYTYDPGETSHHPSVCIMLENVETELIFIDGDTSELDTQATLVIFSVTDPASLTIAQSKLELDLVESDYTDNAIILVGNKVDLVRTRLVPIHGESPPPARFSLISLALCWQRPGLWQYPETASTWRSAPASATTWTPSWSGSSSRSGSSWPSWQSGAATPSKEEQSLLSGDEFSQFYFQIPA